MSAIVTVKGEIFRPLAARRKRDGGTFWIATIKSVDRDLSEFWTVLMFSETLRGALAAIPAGARIEV